MILKVFDNQPSEQTVYLKLVQVSGGIILSIVNEFGKETSQGSLLSLTKEGIKLNKSVSPSYGFNLDLDGRLKVIKN